MDSAEWSAILQQGKDHVVVWTCGTIAEAYTFHYAMVNRSIFLSLVNLAGLCALVKISLCDHFITATVSQFHSSFSNMLSNEMVLNVNMFCPFKELCILRSLIPSQRREVY